MRQWALDEGAFTGARVRYVLDSERLTTGEVPWIEDEPNVRFHAAYEVCASDTLTMTLTVTNTGGEPMSYEAALQRAAQAELAVCFYENEEQRTFRAAIESAPFRTAALLTGPEGGLERSEVEQAQRAGLQICTLGSRILRCETAPLCALSALMYATGEF